MASNLRVDTILPSTGTNVAIGTASGGVTIPGDLGIAGTLTYEDVTNIDSVGVITARSGINVSGGRVLIGTTTEGNSGADDLTIATSGNSGITIRSGTSDYGNIYYSDATSGDGEYAGYVSYQHSTNSLQFATASTERLRISSNGYIGVGVANPNHLLHLHRGDSGNSYTQYTNTTTGSASGDGVWLGMGSDENCYLWHNENKDMYLGTNNTTRLHITSSGYVTTKSELWVGGSAPVLRWRDSTHGEKATARIDGNDLYFEVGNSERLRITSDGKVGINRNNPDALLHIHNSGTTQLPLKVYRNDVGDVPIVHFQGYNNAIGVVDKFVVTTRGRVGVNTDNPQRELHVKPSDNNPATAVPGYIRVEGNGSDQAAILELYHTRGNGNDKWPSSVASVDGGLTLNTANGNNGAPQEKVRITSAGRLGVGVASPISILHLHEAGSNGAPIIQFSNGDTGTTTSDGFAIGLADNESPFIYNRENTDLRIGTNNTERLRIKNDGTVHFYGNQTSTPEGDFGFRWDRNSNVNFQITNTNNTSVNAGGRITLKANIGTFTGTYYNNGGFYLINSANGYFNYYSNSVLRLNIDINGNVTINPGSAAALSSSNGGVGKKFGIKSNANNVIIGETESSGNGSGLHIESRQSGRSGDARIAQIGLKNDAGGNGQISFFTAPSGAGVIERMTITSSGGVGINGSPQNNVALHVKDTVNTPTMQVGNDNVLTLRGGTSSADISVSYVTGAGYKPLKFFTSDTERMRLHVGGTLSIANGLGLGNGVNYAAGNTLDDYEEGSWTPAYSRPNMTIGNAGQVGRYTKVGRVVHIVGKLYTTSESGSSSGGPILVTGLPFTVREVRCALSVRPSGWSNDHPSFATFEKDQTFFELLEEVEGNPSGSGDLGGGRFAGGNGNYLWFGGSYFTDS